MNSSLLTWIALILQAYGSVALVSHERRRLLAFLSGSGHVLSRAGKAYAADGSFLTRPSCEENGLAARLARRDPNELKNRLFGVPPAAQVYPDWLRGDWLVTFSFNGFVFPSRALPRERILRDYEVPGFQKCSIAAVADVGKEQVRCRWRVDPATGWEDRASNLADSIDAHLSYRAVNRVEYAANANPNRISVDFVDYRTTNAERIELFVNARESELCGGGDVEGDPTFVCSEYVRQVTFGTGSTVGVPRQVATNYGLFWTWKQQRTNAGDYDPSRLQGNLLTAGYLDPQDPLYFEEPTRPVVVYSHVLQAKRIA